MQEDGSEIYLVRLTADAEIPKRATEGSAGYDLYSAENIVIEPGKIEKIKTGIAILIPKTYYCKIAGRSSIEYVKGVSIRAGTLDSDFRGEICVVLRNESNVAFDINVGDRIAQMIVERYYTPNIIVVNELPITSRGSGGFGSTGLNDKQKSKKVKRDE